MIRLPTDFKEFLKLLNSHEVEYLLIGGLTVGYYGYPRATGDMDVWVAVSDVNSKRLTAALIEFGFGTTALAPAMFLKKDKVVRMGVPPLRIDILTSISGAEFAECFHRRTIADIDGIEVNVISLADLKKNKRASGRHKDLDDLENLP